MNSIRIASSSSLTRVCLATAVTLFWMVVVVSYYLSFSTLLIVLSWSGQSLPHLLQVLTPDKTLNIFHLISLPITIGIILGSTFGMSRYHQSENSRIWIMFVLIFGVMNIMLYQSDDGSFRLSLLATFSIIVIAGFSALMMRQSSELIRAMRKSIKPLRS